MTAATASRQTNQKVGNLISLIIASGGQVFLGCMAQVNPAGEGVDATATAANTTIGVAHRDASGGESVNVEKSVFAFANSTAGDLVTKADIGKPCYVVDNQTVAKTNNSNARPVAGKVFDVDEYGVWVDFR